MFLSRYNDDERPNDKKVLLFYNYYKSDHLIYLLKKK